MKTTQRPKGQSTPRKRASQARPEPELQPQPQTLALQLKSGALRQPDTVRMLQSVIGNRAVQRLLAQDAQRDQLTIPRQITTRAPQGIVQRNVGFEFEVGAWPVENMTQDITEEQQNGNEQIPDSQIDNAPLEKSDVLATGTDFELQIDEGTNDKHLEFVTNEPGFPETTSGRKSLIKSMKSMTAMAQSLFQLGKRGSPLRAGKPAIKPSEVGSGSEHPLAIILGGSAMKAAPQATAGIRLDQLPSLMEKLGINANLDESEEKKEELSTGRGFLMNKDTDGKIIGPAPGKARAALEQFCAENEEARQMEIGSDALVGLLAMIHIYIKIGGYPLKQYAKTIAPLLARTDFAGLFNVLPKHEKKWFAGDPRRFAQLGLLAAEVPEAGDQPIFAGGMFDLDYRLGKKKQVKMIEALQQLTRDEWLENIPKGEDRLTKAHFPVQKWASELESMGSLGDRTETVGQKNRFKRRKDSTRTEAPIFEFRRMYNSVGFNDWLGLALDVFDFIQAYNDLQDPIYTRANMDKQQRKQGQGSSGS